MCGQVMAAISGIVTACRMRGVGDTLRFFARAGRLLATAWLTGLGNGEERKKAL